MEFESFIVFAIVIIVVFIVLMFCLGKWVEDNRHDNAFAAILYALLRMFLR